MMKILEEVKIRHMAPDATAATTYTLAAGTTSVNSESIDAQGVGTLAFKITLGAVTSTGTGSIKVQGSADGSTNWTDMAGTSQAWADTDSGKELSVEFTPNPAYRYYRLVIARATANSVVAHLEALLGRQSVSPVTQGTGAGQHVRVPEVYSTLEAGTA